jgi:hypothetical protein
MKTLIICTLDFFLLLLLHFLIFLFLNGSTALMGPARFSVSRSTYKQWDSLDE